MNLEKEYCTGCKAQTEHQVEYKTKSDGSPWRDGKCAACGMNRQLPNLGIGDAEFKMPFGKHKGQSLGEIPKDYLLWIAANTEFSHSLRTRSANVAGLLVGPEKTKTQAPIKNHAPIPNYNKKFEDVINSIGLTKEKIEEALSVWRGDSGWHSL